MSDTAHAKYSASNWDADARCLGRRIVNRRAGYTGGLIERKLGFRPPAETSNFYADEGTAAHSVLEACINEGVWEANAHLGRIIPVEQPNPQENPPRDIEVTEEMVKLLNVVLENIRESLTEGAQVFAETKVAYGEHLSLRDEEAWGTADIRVIHGDGTLDVRDLKFGRTPVDPQHNAQGILYALGSIEEMAIAGGAPERVRIFIDQPRDQFEPKVWETTPDKLVDWAQWERENTLKEYHVCETDFEQLNPHYEDMRQQWIDDWLTPNEISCRHCVAKPVCPKLREAVANEVKSMEPPAMADEFDDLTEAVQEAVSEEGGSVSKALQAVDMIEKWCKAVRTEADRRLHRGEPVPGFKLVRGKRGNRAWRSEKEAEELIRGKFRLKVEDAYKMKIIGPTDAEKLAEAGTLGPRRWKQLQELIVQPEGKTHVAPEDDPRPAIDVQPVEEDFTDVTDETADDYSDLC